MRAALMALCLLLGACGARSSRTAVRIANPGVGLQTWCMPITLAQTLGYYEGEGLDVTIENLPSAGKSLQALVGGSVDVAGINYSQSIQIAAEGQHIRSFFVMNNRANGVLAVAPKATDRIHRVEELKGAMIGVSSHGSTSHLWVNHALLAHDVSPSEVQTVAIGLGASAIAALESGRVDAAALSGGDHFQLLRRHPDLRILVDHSTAAGLRDSYGAETYAGGAVGATQNWLDRNPDTARRMARALLRAQKWITAHSPEQILEKLPAEFRTQAPEIDIQILRSSQNSFTIDGAMPSGVPENMKRFLDASVENFQGAKIDLATTWTNEFLPEGK